MPVVTRLSTLHEFMQLCKITLESVILTEQDTINALDLCILRRLQKVQSEKAGRPRHASYEFNKEGIMKDIFSNLCSFYPWKRSL